MDFDQKECDLYYDTKYQDKIDPEDTWESVDPEEFTKDFFEEEVEEELDDSFGQAC